MSLYSVEMALGACSRPEHTKYRCGCAYGARAAFAYLEAHKFRPSSTHDDENTEDQSGIPSEFQ